MKPYRHLLTVSVIFFAVLIAAAVLPAIAARGEAKSDCDCKFDPEAHGMTATLIDKELSSAERLPTSPDLHFPKTLTVCMFYDPTNKTYPDDLRLVFEGSIDGRMWYPLTLAGTTSRLEGSNACLQATPTRYVRAGWGRGSNIGAPGPRVNIQVQASY